MEETIKELRSEALRLEDILEEKRKVLHNVANYRAGIEIEIAALQFADALRDVNTARYALQSTIEATRS
jgi:hypothetical protein